MGALAENSLDRVADFFARVATIRLLPFTVDDTGAARAPAREPRAQNPRGVRNEG